ncbi:MAG: glycoside hydrolase family 3 N-terminal domain-containing protein [Dermabacter sp.]|nr:glycoside hydrolase family 3 N-terminal domain-containing protein [Dermabacter sp.]
MSERAFDPDALAPLLASVPGTNVPTWLADALRDGLGGVVYFGYNTPDAPTAARLSADITRAAGREVMIAIDEEGGDVSRLFAAVGSPAPSARGFGWIDDPVVTRAHARALGGLLAACQVTMTCAPVADVASEPRNPVIGTRAFGRTVADVVRHAGAFADGIREAGVLACAKHFPGHGETDVDSHVGLPRIDLDAERMRREHVAAFAGLKGRVDAVMTAHILVPALGEGPASLGAWSTDLIGEAVPGALIVTDALDMGAITESVGYAEACVRSLEAGAHLLCLGTSIRRDAEAMLREAHDGIAGALDSGRLRRGDLRRRAAEVRTVVEAAAVRRAELQARTGPSPDEVAAAYDALALSLADRAAHWHPAPPALARRGSASAPRVRVLDARRLHDYAAGAGRNFLVPALESEGIEVVEGDTESEAEAGAGAGVEATIVLTRLGLASDADMQALASLPPGQEVIVVHTGVPENAPALEAPCVLTYGAGRGPLGAAARLIARAMTDGQAA